MGIIRVEAIKTEDWKPLNIAGVDPNYIISDKGRIYDKYSKRFLKTNPSKADGFCRVALRSSSLHPTQCVFLLHHLVFQTFHPSNYKRLIRQGHRIIHKDGDTQHNYLTNLELVERGRSYLQKRNHSYNKNTKYRFVGGKRIKIVSSPA